MQKMTTYSEVTTRYNFKINEFCDGNNPYECPIKTCTDALSTNVTYYDLVNYVISMSSSYTLESFRAYKTTEAYKFYQSGWVTELGCKKISKGYIVISRVKEYYHFQSCISSVSTLSYKG